MGKCTKQRLLSFYRQLDEDGFFENFRSQVTETAEKKAAVIEEDFRERIQYQEEDSTIEERASSESQISEPVTEYNVSMEHHLI